MIQYEFDRVANPLMYLDDQLVLAYSERTLAVQMVEKSLAAHIHKTEL